MQNRIDCVDTLRLSPAEYRSIVDDLERLPNPGAKPAIRGQRYPYAPRQPLVLQVTGMSIRYLVRARNLSARGICVLHGSFLYPGTACTIALIARDKEQICAQGTVAHCRCVHGRIHEVGIQFRDEIMLGDFVDLNTGAAAARAAPPAVGCKGICTSAALSDLALKLQSLIANGAAPEEVASVAAQIVSLFGPRAAIPTLGNPGPAIHAAGALLRRPRASPPSWVGRPRARGELARRARAGGRSGPASYPAGGHGRGALSLAAGGANNVAGRQRVRAGSAQRCGERRVQARMLKQHSHFMLIGLVLADALAISTAWLGSYWLRFHYLPVDPEKGVPGLWDKFLPLLPLIVLAHLIIFYRIHLYRPRRSERLFSETRDIVKAFVVAVVVVILIDYFTPEANKISRQFVATYAIVGTTLFAVFRFAVRNRAAPAPRRRLQPAVCSDRRERPLRAAAFLGAAAQSLDRLRCRLLRG